MWEVVDDLVDIDKPGGVELVSHFDAVIVVGDVAAPFALGLLKQLFNRVGAEMIHLTESCLRTDGKW